jgi:hypothetical protein
MWDINGNGAPAEH